MHLCGKRIAEDGADVGQLACAQHIRWVRSEYLVMSYIYSSYYMGVLRYACTAAMDIGYDRKEGIRMDGWVE